MRKQELLEQARVRNGFKYRVPVAEGSAFLLVIAYPYRLAPFDGRRVAVCQQVEESTFPDAVSSYYANPLVSLEVIAEMAYDLFVSE